MQISYVCLPSRFQIGSHLAERKPTIETEAKHDHIPPPYINSPFLAIPSSFRTTTIVRLLPTPNGASTMPTLPVLHISPCPLHESL